MLRWTRVGSTETETSSDVAMWLTEEVTTYLIQWHITILQVPTITQVVKKQPVSSTHTFLYHVHSSLPLSCTPPLVEYTTTSALNIPKIHFHIIPTSTFKPSKLCMLQNSSN